MTEKIVPLYGFMPETARTDAPDADVVFRLEHLLDLAKSGRLRQVAFAGCTSDLSMVTGWVGAGDHQRMTAAIATLHFRYMKTQDAGDENG